MPDTLREALNYIQLIRTESATAKLAVCQGENCGRVLPSSLPLLRFRAKPNHVHDSFYCGQCADLGG